MGTVLCQWLLLQGPQSSLGRGRVPDSPIHFLQSPHRGCETRRYYFKRSPGQVPWHKNLYLVDKTVLSDHYCDIAVITRCNRATIGPFPRASCDLQLHPASKGLQENRKGPAGWEQVQALSGGSRYRLSCTHLGGWSKAIVPHAQDHIPRPLLCSWRN